MSRQMIVGREHLVGGHHDYDQLMEMGAELEPSPPHPAPPHMLQHPQAPEVHHHHHHPQHPHAPHMVAMHPGAPLPPHMVAMHPGAPQARSNILRCLERRERPQMESRHFA